MHRGAQGRRPRAGGHHRCRDPPTSLRGRSPVRPSRAAHREPGPRVLQRPDGCCGGLFRAARATRALRRQPVRLLPRLHHARRRRRGRADFRGRVPRLPVAEGGGRGRGGGPLSDGKDSARDPGARAPLARRRAGARAADGGTRGGAFRRWVWHAAGDSASPAGAPDAARPRLHRRQHRMQDGRRDFGRAPLLSGLEPTDRFHGPLPRGDAR
mmetsp:Transcript_7291/g.23358  ORF Transcript_7291/g.23358 Transcript_7291/m.23358 type:complete len:212 (-) Transcript_7291:819-1454(-)